MGGGWLSFEWCWEPAHLDEVRMQAGEEEARVLVPICHLRDILPF